ncbi:MAG: hypothetical protein KatS3mg128_0089 [Silanimonas sp.]|nr:MAG: hypothetical protein KatS3mg128_0089 [Silanimonas sp.]
MPTGLRTTLNGLTIEGTTYYGAVDLEQVFHARGGAAPAAQVGFRSADGRDLSDWFYPRSAGGSTLEADVGLRTAAGLDLRQVFAKKGTVSAGGGGGGGGCVARDTPVCLAGGGSRRIDEVRPGDVLLGYRWPGMPPESTPRWQDWSVAVGEPGEPVPVTVLAVMLGRYHAHYLINGGLRATYEHVWLVSRGGRWRWLTVAELRPGDAFFGANGQPVPITSIELVETEMPVANLDVDSADCFFCGSLAGQPILSHNSNEKN